MITNATKEEILAKISPWDGRKEELFLIKYDIVSSFEPHFWNCVLECIKIIQGGFKLPSDCYINDQHCNLILNNFKTKFSSLYNLPMDYAGIRKLDLLIRIAVLSRNIEIFSGLELKSYYLRDRTLNDDYIGIFS